MSWSGMSAECRVPLWEELVHTPRVFGKSAEWIESKALEGKNVVYGKWKSAQAYENKGGTLAQMKKVDLPFVAALLRVTILGRMVKRAGINTESAAVAENTEETQGRAAPPTARQIA